MRLRLLCFSLLAALVVAGCSSMPNAADRSQQDPSAGSPSSATGPSPSEVSSPPNRPLPQSPTRARGFEDAVEQGTRTAEGRPGEDYWQQEAAYDLDVQLFPSEKRVDGSATIRYTNNAPTSLRQLHVELAQNLHKEGVARLSPSEVTGGIELRRVTVNGRELSDGGDGPSYAVENTQLVLTPPNAIASGATATIEIDYAFTVPQAGASGRMGYSRDNLFFLAYFYPTMSVYDDVTGWMDDDFMGLAEFYTDFARYDLEISAPDDWVVQATGALQNPGEVLTPETAERRRQAYASDEPMQVLGPDERGTVDAPSDTLTWAFTAERVRDVAVSFTRNAHWDAARTAVGDRDGDGTVDSTRINTFWRESAPKWSEVTAYQQHAITHLSEYMDYPYPWPHMTAVEGGGIIGGGMEFPMMTIMGDYNNNTPRMLYAVTAHELAHMWVPMIVSTNERRYSWMDEGTTSFNENVARKDYFDDSESIASDRQDYIQFARQGREGEIMRWSNYYYNYGQFGIAAYRKPATLLHALRGLLGEETFNRALQEFVNTWAYKHPYPSDFFNTFERVSGRDLDWFWYTWYDTTWTLDQAIAEVRANGDRVDLRIEDDGMAPMPVHLTVTMTDGSTLERTIPVDVWLRGRTSATTTLNVSKPDIRRIEIDADRYFPDVDRSNNTWTAPEQAAQPSGR